MRRRSCLGVCLNHCDTPCDSYDGGAMRRAVLLVEVLEEVSQFGQSVFAERRREILSTADVVVFVCASDPAAVDRARFQNWLTRRWKRAVRRPPY